MADLKIEGDISQINEIQLEFIKNAIVKQGYGDNKVIIEPLGKAGDNYMANVKRIRIEDSNGDLTMVVKISPQLAMQRELGKAEKMFRNEHVMYAKILPKYSQLENAYGVPIQDRLQYPVCYASTDDAPNEIILLEDLNKKNFKMLDRFVPLEDDCVKSILKNMALLHSLSFVLKNKEPHVFAAHSKDLVDVFTDDEIDDKMPMVIKMMEDNILRMLETDVQRNVVKGMLMNAALNFSKMTAADRDSKHSVIHHGDAWTNNFMFCFDDNSVSSMLIDYQLAKVANPACDILFMIATCTDYETRAKQFYEWIDYYHGELDNSLSNFGLKSNFIYSKDQLDADLKRYAKLVFGHALMMTGMLVLKPEEAVLMKEAMENNDFEAFATRTGSGSTNPETIATFKTKVTGITQTFQDFGLI